MKSTRGLFVAALFALLAACGASPEPREGDDRDHGHEAEAVHDHHEGGHEAIRLDEEQIARAGLEIVTATAGTLHQSIGLTGTVELDADRVAHLVPKVAGVVREVRASLGDAVHAGQVLAVMDSRELADARAQYLAARERLALAESLYVREAELWRARVSAEQDYLGARQARAEAEIDLRSAEEQLHALGIGQAEVHGLDRSESSPFTRYEMRAPLDGVVIAKHITVGEFFRDDHAAFTVADLRAVWVDLRVYPKDLASIRVGQAVDISVDEESEPMRGRVAQVGALIAAESRTVSARVALPNADRRLRPGLFVSARVEVDSTAAPVVVSAEALQEIEGATTLFVHDEDGFEARAVEVGRRDAQQAEILRGLDAGERYVARGSFLLKAERGKSEAEHVH